MTTSHQHHTCPSCRSRAIEPVPTTYAKGVRIGRYVTLSGLSHALAPPEPKSEVFTPWCVLIVVMALGYFGYPYLDELVHPRSIETLEALGLNRLLVSCLLGITISLSLAFHRVLWNLNHFSADLRLWQNSFYCRRCGQVHLDPELDLEG